MKYDVHLFEVVRVKIVNVEADSQQDAIDKAEAYFGKRGYDFLNLHGFVPKDPSRHAAPFLECAEWADGEPCTSYLVDEQGDTEYERSHWYDKDRNLDGVKKEATK